MAGQPVRVAVVGLGFGAEFIPIYQRHPRAEMAAICRRDRTGLDEVGDRFGADKRYADYRELLEQYGSPFAVETAHVKLLDSDLTARISRSLFDVARQYRESTDVYGSKRSFEWTLTEGGRHVLHTAKRPEPEIPEEIEVPDFAERLPEPIRRFTTRSVYDDDGDTHLSFTQGAVTTVQR